MLEFYLFKFIQRFIHRDKSDALTWVENVLKMRTTFFELKMFFSFWLNQVEFLLKIWLNQNYSQYKNEMFYIKHVVL